MFETVIKPLDFAACLREMVFTSISESVRLNILALFASVALRNSSVLDGGDGNGVGRLRGSRCGTLMLPLGVSDRLV